MHQVAKSETGLVSQWIQCDTVGGPFECSPIVIPVGLVLVNVGHEAQIDRVGLADDSGIMTDTAKPPSAIKVSNLFAFGLAARETCASEDAYSDNCLILHVVDIVISLFRLEKLPLKGDGGLTNVSHLPSG